MVSVVARHRAATPVRFGGSTSRSACSGADGRSTSRSAGSVETLTRRRPSEHSSSAACPYGLHQQDSIVAGPDGRLYLGSGSTCDSCIEPDPRSAAILSFRPDGSDLRVVATGLRNPYGLVFANGRALRDRQRQGQARQRASRRRWSSASGPAPTTAGRTAGRATRCGRLIGACSRRRAPSRTSSRTRRRTGSPRGAATCSSPSGASTSPTCTAGGSFASAAVTCTTFATGFDHPLALAVGPSGEPVGRRLGPGRDLRDRKRRDDAVSGSALWPLASFATTVTVYVWPFAGVKAGVNVTRLIGRRASPSAVPTRDDLRAVLHGVRKTPISVPARE